MPPLPRPRPRPIAYLAQLPNGKLVLWCYLIWYLSTVAHHFEAAPAIWLNALGISGLIGVALVLSVGSQSLLSNPDRWPLFRLFAMPFCVSSFSSLIKGQGFVLVVPPDGHELALSAALCAGFVLLVLALRRWRRGASA